MVIQAKIEQREKVIEFINRIFNNEDFETLHEKLYSEKNSDMMLSHYIIEENEKIVGAIAMERLNMKFGGKKLRVGVIGSVAVDPDCRGKGYMRELMEHIMALANKENLDMLGLYGDTARYRHYGFEPLGLSIIATFSPNSRKYNAAKDRYTFAAATEQDLENMYNLYSKKRIRVVRKQERFMSILKTWRSDVYVVKQSDKFFGYLIYNPKYKSVLELELKDTNLAGEVLSAFNTEDTITYEFYINDINRLEDIEKYAKSIKFEHCANINVLNKGNVYAAYGRKKGGFKVTDILNKDSVKIFIPRIDNI